MMNEPVSGRPPRYTMVIDLDSCVGCGACIIACKYENGAPGQLVYDPVRPFESKVNGVAKTVFLPLLCMHCEDAPCMKACPSRAIKKRSDGIIVIDEDSCCGFRACVTACPYGAIQVPTDNDMYGTGVFTLLDKYSISRHPANVAQKCTLCAHRIDAGVLRPACVEVCPTECRIFGDLNDPDSRVSKLRAENTLIQLRSDAKSRPSVGYMLATADGKMSGQGIQ